jgi:cyclophilin family peptidyl-prolyl cis-trans isomerase
VISYARTEITRIVKGKFLQAGDIRKAHAVKDEDSASIFESGEFADESFDV